MVVMLKAGTQEDQLADLVSEIEEGGAIQVSIICGVNTTVLGLVGDTSSVDIGMLESKKCVESVKRIQEPYKQANRKFHPDDTIVDVSGHKFGGGHFQVIAGPCSVESAEQITQIAQGVKQAGATMIRGGAFKPRTSPYSFQGLGADGIELLLEAKKATGMPIVSEILNINHLPLFEKVDIIQVGARNMQNFEMLKELGKTRKPILLKRGLANTIEEFLMSAEYVLSGGNQNVILCERGIRTFETQTRNTLDISAIPVLKRLSHLPVVIDPSHAAGLTWLVEPLSKAAVAAGADGLIIEVHNNPPKALSDGAQSLTPLEFQDLFSRLNRLIEFEGKSVS